MRRLLVSALEETMRRITPLIAFLAAAVATAAFAQKDDDRRSSEIRHVLLISIDGMHAVDYRNCSHGIAGVNNGNPYCPNLASLATTGVNYVNASTSKPSDSFPGLMTIISGATPRLMGVLRRGVRPVARWSAGADRELERTGDVHAEYGSHGFYDGV
jgi:Type I phosphodiesterase / nucleotide pyrophosphatase